MIIVAGKIPIQLDKLEEAKKVATVMAQATQLEEGCLEYHFYSNVEDPATLLIFERWESAEALAAHFETPHMAEFRKQIPHFVAGTGEIYKYEISEASKL